MGPRREGAFVIFYWHRNGCQILTRILFKPELEVERNCLDPPLLQPLQDLSQQPRRLPDDLRLSHFFQAFAAAETLICCRDELCQVCNFLLCLSLLVVVSCADTSAGVGALRLFGSPPPRKVSLLLLLLLLLLSGVAPPALTHYCTRQSTTP